MTVPAAVSRQSLLAASLTSFTLAVLLGLAVLGGWHGATVLDGPAEGLRAWAADRPGSESLLLRAEALLGYDGMTVATLLLAGWLLLRRQARAAVVVVAVMWSTKEVTQAGKDLFDRVRPSWQDADHFLHSGSYPSAHASTVAAFAGLLLAVTLLSTRRAAPRWIAGAVSTTLLLAVFADRLLLGRHYPTDLLGGLLLAGAVVLLGLALLRPAPVVPATRELATQRGATHAGDAPLEREPVLSRSA